MGRGGVWDSHLSSAKFVRMCLCKCMLGLTIHVYGGLVVLVYSALSAMQTFFQTLRAFSQSQPDKYTIFIHHRLTVVLCLWKRGLSRKFSLALYCPVKSALFRTVRVFGSTGHFYLVCSSLWNTDWWCNSQKKRVSWKDSLVYLRKGPLRQSINIQTQGITERPYQASYPLSLFPKAWHRSESLAAADVVPDSLGHRGEVSWAEPAARG